MVAVAFAAEEKGAVAEDKPVKAEGVESEKKQEKRGIFSFGYGEGHGGYSIGEGWKGDSGDWQPSYGHHEEHVKTIEIVKKVPVPYTVEKHVPYTVEKKVPYEVKVPYPQPYTVEKKVPYTVKEYVKYPVYVPAPYTVEKKVPYEVKVPVDKPYEVEEPKALGI